ncbi:unnamed protein product [Durusdinium trenchii]|uniref:Uncharacterized protein n=1 Tax=Durusdinium trenchii TaxID=1381693 RepID=A0ABP0KYV6_9DINO
MARRAERLMLGTLWVPRSITAIRVVCRDNPVVVDWMHRFVPMLRYGSPALEFHFHRLQIQAKETDAKASEARGEDEEVKEEEEGAPAANKASEQAEGAGAAPDAGPADVVSDDLERMELEFADDRLTSDRTGQTSTWRQHRQPLRGTKHLLNMELYISSHQVMQRILDVDAEKTLSIV